MADALTIPHAVAAIVLCVAGFAKLRSPGAAARAVGLAPALIRCFAALEVALGVWAVLTPGPTSSALMAALYAGFAGLSLALTTGFAGGAGAGSACGCFGAERAPASPIQSLMSATLALACAVSAAATPHGLGWIFGRPVGIVTVLVLGTAGAVYGIVVAYSELPPLWRAWSPVAGRLMRPPAVASHLDDSGAVRSGEAGC